VTLAGKSTCPYRSIPLLLESEDVLKRADAGHHLPPEFVGAEKFGVSAIRPQEFLRESGEIS
jgi:hypothetical protein